MLKSGGAGTIRPTMSSIAETRATAITTPIRMPPMIRPLALRLLAALGCSEPASRATSFGEVVEAVEVVEVTQEADVVPSITSTTFVELYSRFHKANSGNESDRRSADR